MTLICLSFVMFGAVYMLRLDAWEKFDPGRILGASQSLLVYDKDGNEVSCLSGTETRISIPLRDIPLHVRYAFISAEDNRFYEHIGVDFIRILGAAWEDVKAGSYVQGASTISQQLVKLSHLTNEKVMTRKLEEAVLAYQMEQQYSKDEILEMYLNYIYFGGGFYGVEAAARGYFGVHANELSLAQAALLAGIIKSPSHYAPHLDLEASTGRRNLVLRLMQEYGYIDEQTCIAAQEEPVALKNGLNQEKRGYYIDLALDQACNSLGVSMDEILTGGYRLYTAMDSQLQTRCEEVLKDPAMFPEEAEDAQAALVVVDAETGGVAALMGGRESSTALAYNRATRIRRQPGSVIKPIIAYAPALEEYRYTTVSMLLDEPTDFNGYQPDNFNEKYRGWVTMRESVAQSLNIPAVKVLDDIGVEAGKRFAQSVGIPFDERDNSLALALGGFTYGVSPYQIAGAYAAFATGGLYSTPSLVLSITDSRGDPLYTYEPERMRVMSEENAYILSDMLQSAISEGTGRRLGELDFALAGKTGTTGEGEGNRDAWMAAYNPEYAAAVWMGYDDSAGGTLPQGATGGKYPAMILSEVFSKLYEDREAPVFQRPAGVVEVRLDRYTLDNAHMAVLAGALTPPDSIVREVFAAGTEPENMTDYWVVPQPPTTFLSQLNAEGRAELTFMPVQSFMLYRLYREDSHGVALLLGEWPGGSGAVRYTDTTAEFGRTYEYYVVPAHPQLTIGGKQVVGPASKRLTVQIPANPFIAGGAA
ncbi:MAG TPA: PBP1A family penicillin-binding protein [Feifaniaceae bacterium]|nr:PBP1A family penicillin-binding protein [Feifaniaceae bacterium]